MKRPLLLFLSLFSFTFSQAQSPGNALDFDGVNDVVNASVPACLTNVANNDFTIEAWVYPKANAFSRIVFAQQSTSNFVALSTGSTANIYFYVVEGGTTYSVSTNNSMPLNQWTHVAAVFETATNAVSVYYNGVLQAGTAGGSSSTGTSGIMSLGTRPGGAQYFTGSMDEVRIWNVARTECQIFSNYTSKLAGNEANLEVYYDFDQGTAGGTNAGVTTLPDLVGSNDGTLSGFALSGTTSNWITSGATITSTGLNGGTTTTENVGVCSGNNYTFPDGTVANNITSPTSHTSNLIAVSDGCDSIIVTNVSVNASYDLIETVTVCSGDDYTYPDGTMDSNITFPSFHISNLNTALGCDSIISTTIVVATVDTSVTVGAGTLTTNAIGATYDWVECGGFTSVGVTTAAFTPLSAGNYAVEVTQGECTALSSCYPITIGIDDLNSNTAFEIYPNPTRDQITIDLSAFGMDVSFSVLDLSRKVILQKDLSNPGVYTTALDLPQGMYMISIRSEQASGTQRLIVE